MDESKIWDFRDRRLAMNILCPDPDLQGIWDWRSPYYLSGTVDVTRPPAHRHVIEFLADLPGPDGTRLRPGWIQFIVEYHRDDDERIKFVGLARALPPFFPTFDAAYKPKYPPLDDPGGGPGDGKPPGRPAGPAGGAKKAN